MALQSVGAMPPPQMMMVGSSTHQQFPQSSFGNAFQKQPEFVTTSGPSSSSSSASASASSSSSTIKLATLTSLFPSLESDVLSSVLEACTAAEADDGDDLAAAIRILAGADKVSENECQLV
jgi:hypothetical protein